MVSNWEQFDDEIGHGSTTNPTELNALINRPDWQHSASSLQLRGSCGWVISNRNEFTYRTSRSCSRYDANRSQKTRF